MEWKKTAQERPAHEQRVLVYYRGNAHTAFFVDNGKGTLGWKLDVYPIIPVTAVDYWSKITLPR